MILKSTKIVLEDEIVNDVEIEIKDGKIIDIRKSFDNTTNEILKYEDLLNHLIKNNCHDESISENICIDFSDCYICPGFVDTHIHGFSGHDIMDKSIESINRISKGLLNAGVTSYLATTLTSSISDIDEVIKLITEYSGNNSAKVQGIFLEGPFFTTKYKGAQNDSYFLEPDIDLLRRWHKSSKGLLKKVALSPEYKNSVEFVKAAKKLGITVALGHSDASFYEAKESVDNGASIFIHTYNAMSPLHHREPGMVGASLTLENTYSEVICDGHHVHPVAIDVLLRCKKPEKVVLISDCMMAGGMPDGKYKLGEYDVNVENGAAKLKEGNLAGSVLKLSNAVKNIVNWGISNPFDAIQMASLIPAKSVNINNVCGKIEIGRCADLTILDSNLDIVAVVLDGKINIIK